MRTEEKNDKNDKKSVFLEKLIERQNEAKVVRKIVAIIALSIFLMVVLILGGGYLYINSALKPVDPQSKEEKIVEIPIGSGVSTISQILEGSGVIKNARIFKYYVKFKNESGFMAGEYVMNPSMTLPEIIDGLKTGKMVKEAVFKLTIPEGNNLDKIAGIIAEKTDYSKEDVLNKVKDPKFIDLLINQYNDLLTDEILDPSIKYPLEGYLFPATYSFYEEKPTIDTIIMDMLDKTKTVVDEYRIQMDEQELTVHKLLTMASLIEEEATGKVDRDQIASVFYNRMESGMPLQTDPTVLYAKGEHQERVYYKDLEIDDPYNTYKNKGLTPGPIANAGTSSIEAALMPADTEFFYFLATPEGEVLFSVTLDEHNERKAKHISGSE
ncbi:endolytic transglycosylase MltG [Bacillus sp. V3B]|uniref:endolytic transglycosylase MltG n=1 Tax=Bacillus sp. V3B TaxID=2804915 RepID=UPI0021099280|nr:endolytic transglycosylase MltG [Bacillus sp. V3B]MCQ6273589.1 endolytic transglycosylase MltG [Bacillus sp. V3B]